MDDGHTISYLVEMVQERDALIMKLAERVYLCSRILTCAAEELGWDHAVVQQLVQELRQSTEEDARHAGV